MEYHDLMLRYGFRKKSHGDRTNNIFLLASLFLILSPAFATEGASFPKLSANEFAVFPHSHAEETERIRTHHLKRLADKLSIEPSVLRETCRYESEISTRPPVKRVLLTFDDGPDPEQTEFILSVLKKHDIHATFFLIGKKAQAYPGLVEKIAEGRHAIGNHSWDHPNFHEISAAEQAEEFLKTDKLLFAAEKPKLFRYPYGNSSCETNDLVHAHDYKIVGWHIDSCDWAFDRTGSVDTTEAISCGVLPQNRKDFVEHVVSSVRGHNGGIVLMHEIHPNTLQQLEGIITKLEQDGFTFGTIDDVEFGSSLR